MPGWRRSSRSALVSTTGELFHPYWRIYFQVVSNRVLEGNVSCLVFGRLWLRYHGDWRTETQMAVSMLAFTHWLETGGLLMHAEAQEKLGCMSGPCPLL